MAKTVLTFTFDFGETTPEEHKEITEAAQHCVDSGLSATTAAAANALFHGKGVKHMKLPLVQMQGQHQ